MMFWVKATFDVRRPTAGRRPTLDSRLSVIEYRHPVVGRRMSIVAPLSPVAACRLSNVGLILPHPPSPT